MKKIQSFAILILLSTSTFVNSGCPSCSDTLALCDLLIKSFTAPSEIVVGQAFDVLTGIGNDADGGKCTTTELASSTTNLLQIFLNDGFGNWNPVAENPNIQQQGISAGDAISLFQNLTINQAGDYRFDYYDDSVDDVDERNENNNYGQTGKSDIKSAIQQTNNFASIYITVRPLPDGTTQIQGKPIVEFK